MPLVIVIAGASTAAAHEIVPFHKAYCPGTIVVATGTRQLFYVLNGNRALRYPVGVGKAGMA